MSKPVVGPGSGRAPVALTIAGTDSGGGAGISADLATFAVHDVWGTCAVVAVTAQNTQGVGAVGPVAPELVSAQIASVAIDIGVDAAKTGMLATAAHLEVVADAVAEHRLPNLVVDPVAVSSHGEPLLAPDALAALRHHLLPLARVVTPNLAEAAALCGLEPDAVRDRDGMRRVAEMLGAMGVGTVVVKGGHLDGPDSPDLLWSDGDETWLDGDRLDTGSTHGTGCVMSASLAARLARGEDMVDAAVGAKRFVTAAIVAGRRLGSGAGSVDPWAARSAADRVRSGRDA